jgi:hypothetical protein
MLRKAIKLRVENRSTRFGAFFAWQIGCDTRQCASDKNLRFLAEDASRAADSRDGARG